MASPVTTRAGKDVKKSAKKVGRETKEGAKAAAKGVAEGFYTAADVAQGAMEGFSAGVGYTDLGKKIYESQNKTTLDRHGTQSYLYDEWEQKQAPKRKADAKKRRAKQDKDVYDRMTSTAKKARERDLAKYTLEKGEKLLADPKLREAYNAYNEVDYENLMANADANALEAFHERFPGFNLRPDEIEAMRRAENVGSYMDDLKRREQEVNTQIADIADLIDAQEVDTGNIVRKSLSETGKDPRIVAAEKKRLEDEARIKKQAEEMVRPSGLSETDIKAFAQQRKNAQAAAEKGGAFEHVDRRAREREMRKARADRLAKSAQELGYKNVTRESVLESLQKRFRGMEGDPSHDDMMSMMSTMRNDMYRNANKRFMNERGAAMNKADAQAADRRSRTLAGLSEGIRQGTMAAGAPSEAQLAAKARWDAKREANSANYNKGAANRQFNAYMAGPQYGRDVYTGAQRQWGPNARTQLDQGGAAYNYAQALDFNKQFQDAQIRSMDANAQLAQNRANVINGITKTVENTKPGGTPTQSDINAVATTPMTSDKKTQTI